MSEIKEYKCPACGGAMEFDSKSQKMKCPYCDTEISVDEYESLIAKADQVVAADAASDVETEQKKSENYIAHDWNQDEIDNMVVYICQSCGGEITADKNTGATTCPFCGNRALEEGRQMLRPWGFAPKNAEAVGCTAGRGIFIGSTAAIFDTSGCGGHSTDFRLQEYPDGFSHKPANYYGESGTWKQGIYGMPGLRCSNAG